MIPEYIIEKIKNYKKDGYEIIPCDDLTRGMRGLLAIKNNKLLEEEFEFGSYEILLEWPLFGKPLIPEESSVDINEFIEFMNDPEVILHDFPKTLDFGSIKYLPEDGRVIVKKIKTNSVRKADESDKLNFSQKRQLLVTRNKSYEQNFEEIIAEISAIN